MVGRSRPTIESYPYQVEHQIIEQSYLIENPILVTKITNYYHSHQIIGS